MKIALLYPGHQWSTKWVAEGYNHALDRLGVDVVDVHTENLIGFASKVVQDNKEIFVKLSKDNEVPESEFTWTMHLASQLAIVRLMELDQVDVVLNVCGKMFSTQNNMAYEKVPFPKVVMLTESPYEDEHQKLIASFHDFATVNDLSSVASMSEVVPTAYLRHAYHEEIYNPDTDFSHSIHNRTSPDEREIDVFWVGTPFGNRKRILDKVKLLEDYKLCIVDDIVVKDEGSTLPKGISFMPPQSTATMYNKSKINLNIHRKETGFGTGIEVDTAVSLGPRTFEIAGCAAFQLSDNTRPELKEIFGDTVATYDNEDDVPELIKYWLDPARDKQRQEMAQASHEIVYPRHTYLARSVELIDQLASWYGKDEWRDQVE